MGSGENQDGRIQDGIRTCRAVCPGAAPTPVAARPVQGFWFRSDSTVSLPASGLAQVPPKGGVAPLPPDPAPIIGEPAVHRGGWVIALAVLFGLIALGVLVMTVLDVAARVKGTTARPPD